ncbi:MAG: hypothetical protein JXR77_07885 [Lentisphaeria bacterium]|nr:hypothetical protein [Lentisphaeria bacterium]
MVSSVVGIPFRAPFAAGLRRWRARGQGAGLAALVVGIAASAGPPPHVWIEAESLPAKPACVEEGWSGHRLVAGGRLLAIHVPSGDVAARVPEEGVLLTYPVRVPEEGEYEIWNRVVFENIRSPFEWRLDEGAWSRNSQGGQPITNVQELGFWNPIGWTRMGRQPIARGNHTLHIRISRHAKDPAKPDAYADLHYVSDALLLSAGPFRPNYRFRPDEDFRDERDRQAAAETFRFADGGGPRETLPLTGLWEFAPYEELGEISEESRISGVMEYPDSAGLAWRAIPVPGDRNRLRPDERYAHRFAVRSRVDLPGSMGGCGFHLVFEAISMIATLFVNGRRCGDFDLVKSRWQVDVGDALRPGQANEILLVVKDSFYAIAADPKDPANNVRRNQYFPEELFASNQGVTHRFDFPAANGHGQAGLLDTVTLVATRAPVYVEDVFVKPMPVTQRRIDIDVTLRNASPRAATAHVANRIRPWRDPGPGAAAGDTRIDVPAGGAATVTLSTPSEPYGLWDIFAPVLHEVVTEVTVDRGAADRCMTRFGNREWELRGNRFYLNGIPRHLRADLTHYGGGDHLESIARDWKDLGVNMFRRRFQFPWSGMPPPRILAWMDEIGMPVRQNAGTFDGQVASYRLVQDGGPRKVLFERWRRQILNGVRARRNHPSVFLWELDNEIVYINGRNFGWLDSVEPEFAETSRQVMALDPTRATVTGGGAALRDESLPVYGIHYFEVHDRHYPDEAYTGEESLALEGSGRSGRVWPVHPDAKPIFFSETAFLPGRNPAGFAAVGGEVTFLGKRESRPASGRIASWLAEGYRWKGYGGVHFWFDRGFTDGSYSYAWQPVAILCRQWNWTFESGSTVSRDLRLYNDPPDSSSLRAAWTLEVAGRRVAEETHDLVVSPGEFRPFTAAFRVPEVEERSAGVFRLRAFRGQDPVFEREIPFWVVPPSRREPAPVDGDLVVWDPDGSAARRLAATGYGGIRQVTALDEVPDRFGLLVVGRNAIPKPASTHRRWLALAAAGNRMLFLEQENPLHFQATPADVEPTGLDGRVAFSQDLTHPIFAGILQDDLCCWAGSHVVYRNALRKPTKGAVSLVQCDEALGCSAMTLSEVGDGIQLASQLAIGEGLDSEPAARRLFDNMVHFAAGYTKTVRDVRTVTRDALLGRVLAEIGVAGGAGADPLAAIAEVPGGVVVLEGTPENLARLGAAADTLRAHWEQGGWLVVLAVTPESLDAFNALVGREHILRPFRQELVRFPATRDPLTSGLTLRDVVMSSGRRIQTWNRDEWPTDDAFDFIVDLDDIAPFCEFPPPAYWNDPGTQGPGDDTWPLNMVNGFTADTHWRMVFSIHLAKGDPSRWTMRLPRSETIREVRITPNRIYHRITGIRLAFDDGEESPRTFRLDPGAENQVLTLDPPVRASTLELTITDWEKSGRADVVGIDNLEILVARDEDFYARVRPLLNIGGLVRYPRGRGGVLLSQYVFRERETNPVNLDKKRTVLATLLRNLGAAFSGERLAIPGFNLSYRPSSLEGFANLYVTRQQGWPGRDGDLGAMPRGENRFAGVPYVSRDFTTSPLETAVTLRHGRFRSNAQSDAVRGMAANGRADAVFFLHTFLPAREWRPRRPEDEPPVVFRYLVHYDDGSEAPVDVVLGRGVGPWQTAEPTALPGAEIAWAARLQGREDHAVVYQMQWNNPHPARSIAGIDLLYGDQGDTWGAPVLLGITTATVLE